MQPTPLRFCLSVAQQLRMQVTTLCTVVAVLRIVPNRFQYFRYDSVTMSCMDQKPSDWRIKRNTTTTKNEECLSSWGKGNKSHCFISDVYPSDSGEYWCESGPGMCSNVINITVTDGSVILESPVLPVAEGETATLRCISKEPSYFNHTEFYKDGLLVENSSTGVMIIHQVSTSHEGFYKCNLIGAGESADSWLTVTVGPPEAFHSSLTHILLPALGGCLSLASVMLLCLKRNRKATVDHDVLYIDVTFPQEEQAKGLTERTAEPTVYSTVRPRAT